MLIDFEFTAAAEISGEPGSQGVNGLHMLRIERRMIARLPFGSRCRSRCVCTSLLGTTSSAVRLGRQDDGPEPAQNLRIRSLLTSDHGQPSLGSGLRHAGRVPHPGRSRCQLAEKASRAWPGSAEAQIVGVQYPLTSLGTLPDAGELSDPEFVQEATAEVVDAVRAAVDDELVWGGWLIDPVPVSPARTGVGSGYQAS